MPITPTPESPIDATARQAARMTPGAFEPRVRVPRQPGAMSNDPSGAGLPTGGASTMAEATTVERQREGGGSVSERR